MTSGSLRDEQQAYVETEISQQHQWKVLCHVRHARVQRRSQAGIERQEIESGTMHVEKRACQLFAVWLGVHVHAEVLRRLFRKKTTTKDRYFIVSRGDSNTEIVQNQLKSFLCWNVISDIVWNLRNTRTKSARFLRNWWQFLGRTGGQALKTENAAQHTDRKIMEVERCTICQQHLSISKTSVRVWRDPDNDLRDV